MATSAKTPEWLEKVLSSNNSWATTKADPALLEKLSKGQSPEILWLGCSDSRVPETTLLGLNPGDVFVHRNIANVLHGTDLSSLSVLEYAIVYLKVKHVIVCGHTSCGGVAAALDNKCLGKIDTWLTPLRKVRMDNADELAALGSDAERNRRLVDLNVLNSVETIKQNPDFIKASKERGLDVTGLVYDLASGKLVLVDTTDDALSEKRISAFTTS